jgi:drug/metabolite transporter (DMT)-like permease
VLGEPLGLNQIFGVGLVLVAVFSLTGRKVA